MTKAQYAIAAKLLGMAASEFSNHNSNDHELSNTPENLKFVEEMIAASDYPDDKLNVSSDGKTIYTSDVALMRYCQKLLVEEIFGQ